VFDPDSGYLISLRLAKLASTALWFIETISGPLYD
jgi:hypothetical protein